jgi:BASS family bile acid:Na+ symporter
MFLLNSTEKILILTFIVTTMLSIGMQTGFSDLRSLVASRSFLIRTLVANFLVIPIVGVAMALVLPIEPYVAGALILLACTPGGMSTVQFTGKVKGEACVAGAVMCMLSLLSLIVSPALLQLVLPATIRLVVPYGDVLLYIVLFMLLPLLAGMLLLDKVSAVALKLSKPLSLVGLVTFLTFMVVTGSFRQAATGEIGLVAVAALLLFFVICMLVGWLLGGPTRNLRQILATATSMRNAALCLAIVESSSPSHAVLVPLISFSLLMVPTNMLFTIFFIVQAKMKARKAA